MSLDMWRTGSWAVCGALTVLLFVNTAYAGEHIYSDWAVACSNTRRCEAAGYHASDWNPNPIGFFIARNAGPATQVEAAIMVQIDGEEPPPLALTLRVGEFTVEGLPPDGDLTSAQINALLPHLLNADKALVTNGKFEWTLSLKGLKAALLKMDDLQGRVGTPGALVRKGAKPEASVLPALPPPVLKGVLPPPDKPGDAALLANIPPEINAKDFAHCSKGDVPERSVSIHRLSGSQVLVERMCELFAYQATSVFWIANDSPPYSPRAVSFLDADGKTITDLMTAQFEKGMLSSASKGRGSGDCWDNASWLWTADGFKLLSATSSPLCKDFLGGGYELTKWVAEQAR